MLIKVQQTPNPNSMKFIVDKKWLNFVWECFSDFDAKKSDLANTLWKLEGVMYLMFGHDFVSVSKKHDALWEILSPEIVDILSEFLLREVDLFDTQMPNMEQKNFNELEQKIAQVLEEKVQPAIENHGGMISLVKVENGVVFLDLQGACRGCPSSTLTLKNGIENLLKYYFSEIKSVESV